jgi:tetratricopeptide (TPR) repeat protein
MRWMATVGASGLALWVVITPARAQSEPTAEDALRIAFSRGQTLEQAGRFTDAWLTFEQIERARPTAEVTFHAALCLERMGRLLRARARFLLALERATSAPLVQREASSHLEDLAARIPTLTVALLGRSAGVTLLLDGEPLAEGKPTPVDPGPHVVVALRDGRSVAAIAFASAERQARQLRLPIRLKR